MFVETVCQPDHTEQISEPTNGGSTNRAHPVAELGNKSHPAGPKMVPKVASHAARFRKSLPRVSAECGVAAAAVGQHTH